MSAMSETILYNIVQFCDSCLPTDFNLKVVKDTHASQQEVVIQLLISQKIAVSPQFYRLKSLCPLWVMSGYCQSLQHSVTMEAMDITFRFPRMNRKVSGKMPAPNNFFLKLSKEHFVLSTIYGTLYIFLMKGSRATSCATTESQQTVFLLPKVLSSHTGVAKVN